MDLRVSPAELFSSISERSDISFLLESAADDGKHARYSFVGFSPRRHITLKRGVLEICGEQVESRDPIGVLRDEMPSRAIGGSAFVGGALGYLSYDFVRHSERLGRVRDAVRFPDLEFGIFDDAIAFDHKTGDVQYLHQGENRLPEVLEMIKDSGDSGGELHAGNVGHSMSKDRYCENVKKAKEYIAAGDIMQVVLSRRCEFNYSGTLMGFYDSLKRINPSPYMYYLKFKDRQIIGSSPENLVRVDGSDVSSYATLAGTRPRGKTRKEDMALERELTCSKKDRAEHIMLVDLTRNDLGKVSEPGTVKVHKLMRVKKYSHVQHMSSLVTGRLRKGNDALDALKAVFPAGTVSGAPKVRAMQIIDELEGERRGPYGGAVGYLSYNGSSDFAICIRTLFANRNRASVQAGAGIVYDSDPEAEFYETENKASALMKALDYKA